MTHPVAIVLAAGQGTRMKSDLPKVLVPVLGRPMIRYVIDALHRAAIEDIILVVGYRADEVRAELADEPTLRYVEQREQLGTGHAVMMCRDTLADHDGPVIILTGDSPLTQPASIRLLLTHFATSTPACLIGTARTDDPTGLGRILRDASGEFKGIVEEKDATKDQRRITEVNMSTYVFACQDLLSSLGQLTCKNVQTEYYLTDCPGLLLKQGKRVQAIPILQPCEALSINTLDQLKMVEQEISRSLQRTVLP
ncbi:MAG: NTP transferase domain-containing protein [Pirellulales bacterium]|nr:NTP transferase domain-containing protein [Pirellulales bacterium]